MYFTTIFESKKKEKWDPSIIIFNLSYDDNKREVNLIRLDVSDMTGEYRRLLACPGSEKKGAYVYILSKDGN